MSTLQRKIQQESRSSSRARSGGNSRQSSRSSSRMGSRVQSDDEDDYTSNAFLSGVDAEDLINSLDSLVLDSNGEGSASGGGSTAKDRFTESLEMLGTHERKTSLEAREKALLTVLSILTVKYEPERIDNYALEQFTKAFRYARSDLERMLSLQTVCICGATDPDLTAEFAAGILPKLLDDIGNDDVSVNVRANYAFGYGLLQFFMLYGSGAYGADELANQLIEIADGFSLEEGSIASACVLGAGLIISAMPNPNSAIEDSITYLIYMLDKPSVDLKLAAGKVLAMYFQNYIYEAESDENSEEEAESIPFVDQGEILYKLRNLVGESSKKLTKRDKREQKSLFRDVIKTIEGYSSVESRENLTLEDINITHVKMAKSKSMPVDSWNKLILIQMYKWLFGPGINTQYMLNPLVQETIDNAGIVIDDYGTSANNNDDLAQLEQVAPNKQQERYFRRMRHESDRESRKKNIQKQRQEKMQYLMGE